MLTIKKGYKNFSKVEYDESSDVSCEEYYQETAGLEVNGTGNIVIRNTGGSSASEGGMGSGSDDDREKGSLSKPGEKSGSASSSDDEDLTFDPIKKSAREAEKERGKE